MIGYLMKNNMKLMLRNKWVIAVMIAGPILTIALLSSAFQDLMKSYEGVEEFKAGYRVEKGSVMGDNITLIKEAGKETGITFEEYPQGKPKEVIEHNELAGFVEFNKDTYKVYESADFEVEGITLEYFLSRIMKESGNQVLQTMVPVKNEKITLPVQKLDYLPAVDAKDYYGIIYIVYFSWCGMVCAANVLNNEKKYGIERKFQVTGLSDLKLYLGKWIPTVFTVTVGMGAAVIATIFLFDIHWGNPLISATLLLLTIMAGSAFGLMLYSFCRNLAITIIALFTSVWFMGFFGGSFETYMFSSWSDTVKSISPIYHINRALVEHSCMGYSTYTKSCILYMLAIIIVCSALAVAADKIRRRGRA